MMHGGCYSQKTINPIRLHEYEEFGLHWSNLVAMWNLYN